MGLVGIGQFGKVYCARQQNTGELVALKELPGHYFPTHAFLRELRYLLSLDHENITHCLALKHTREGRYLVLEYCEGGTLRDLMSLQAPMSYAQILNYIQQILRGLAHAHDQGVIHCDVKPENILLKPVADSWLLKLTDLGIARHQVPHSNTITATGSPAYMAPERYYGQVFPASDLYAVGVLLYELLAGHRPFSGSPQQLMYAHLNHSLTMDPMIPFLLRPILEKSLRKLPSRRFHHAVEMSEALEAVVSSLQEPIHCWLLPEIPRVQTPKSERYDSIGSEVTTVISARKPSSSLLWAVDHHIFRKHQGQSQRLTTLPEPITHLYSLETESTATSGILVITSAAVYLVFPPQEPRQLLYFTHEWRHLYIPDKGWLFWATSEAMGLVQCWSELQLGERSLFTQEIVLNPSFYRWPQPFQGLPAFAWLDSENQLALHGEIHQKQRLFLCPASSVPDLQSFSDQWQFPLARTGQLLSAPGGHVLLLHDSQSGELLRIFPHPFRVCPIPLQGPVQQVWTAAWGFAVRVDQHLVLLDQEGRPFQQMGLEAPFRIKAIPCSDQLWLEMLDTPLSIKILDLSPCLQQQTLPLI
jgi:serine/threonine-protein kinase